MDVSDAASVLYLAHKYNVPALSNHGSELMKTEINLDNVVEIYQMANLFQQQDLKTYAMNFMSR